MEFQRHNGKKFESLDDNVGCKMIFSTTTGIEIFFHDNRDQNLSFLTTIWIEIRIFDDNADRNLSFLTITVIEKLSHVFVEK